MCKYIKGSMLATKSSLNLCMVWRDQLEEKEKKREVTHLNVTGNIACWNQMILLVCMKLSNISIKFVH